MRISLIFRSDSPIKLPLSYNHILQGFIYQYLTPELSTSLHQEGYQYRKRSFKIMVSSPLERFIHEMAEALLKKPEIEHKG